MVSKPRQRAAVTLITGATGGLGQALCAKMRAEGREVRAIGRNREIGKSLEEIGCQFVRADLVEAMPTGLMQNVKTVFHLAAISRPWGRPQDFEAVNVRATERLIASAKESECNAFLYASTPSIFSRNCDQFGLAEDDPPAHPFANGYARTKYLAEQLVLDANRQGFATTALRPRAIVGPKDTVLLPRLMRAAQRGFMPLPREGKALIEITDARDVVSAFLAAEDRITAASGKPFNISGGQPVTLKRLLLLVFQALDLKVRLIPFSAKALHSIGAGLERVYSVLPGRPEPLLTRYIAQTLSYSQTFDLSRARKVLGWEPKYAPELAISHALKGARQ